MNIKRDSGWLALRFRFEGDWHTEYLGIRDTRENLRVAKIKMERIKAQLLLGTFDYAEEFPGSRFVKTAPVRTFTLTEFYAAWIDGHAHNLVPEVARDYRDCLRLHIQPHKIGSMLMSDITDDDLGAFIGDLKTKLIYGRGAALTPRPIKIGDHHKPPAKRPSVAVKAPKVLSPRRINMIIARLRTVFKKAARTKMQDGRRMIAEDPMLYVSNERAPKSSVDPFTQEEALAIIGMAEGQFRSILTVLLFAGLRPNEALALHWDDIDWRNGYIKVRRTLSREGERLPKTAGSERDVTMIDIVRRALSDQQARTRFGKSGLVFSNDDRSLHLSVLRTRDWARVLIKAHIRYRAIYSCRHSFATICLSNGDTVQHVASELGHTSIQMVVAVYGRWTRKPSDGGSAARIDASNSIVSSSTHSSMTSDDNACLSNDNATVSRAS